MEPSMPHQSREQGQVGSLLFVNGRVVDGTGHPWTYASVAVADGRIVAVGDIVDNGSADEVIDLEGRIICPGFVDMHGHSDFLILAEPTVANKMLQGITTEVAGLCGFSAAPIRDRWHQEWWVGPGAFEIVSRKEGKTLLKEHGVSLTWSSLAEYLECIERVGPGINHLTFVGQVPLRVAVMDDYRRDPQPSEIEEMVELLRESMLQGAFGFSTDSGDHGKIEVSRDELVTMFRETARAGGRVAYHIEDYEDQGIGAMEDAIQNLADAGVRGILSHVMSFGRENWGKTPHILRLIDEARAQGMELWADMLPYPDGTGLFWRPRAAGLLSECWRDLAPEELARVLSSSDRRQQLREELEHPEDRPARMKMRGWPHYLRIENTRLASVEGKTIAQLSREQGLSPVDAFIDVLARDPRACQSFSNEWEQDKQTVAAHPLVGFGTDAPPIRAVRMLRPPEMIATPVLYSAFPYVLQHYVRETGVLRLEEAIRKMTSLPMIAHGIRGRGLVRDGYWADLVVIDPETVGPRISYDELMPTPPCDGIDLVVVNGVIAVRDGVHTGRRAGMVIRNQDH